MWLLAEFDDGRHPDLHMQERTCGVCHSAGGRLLPRFITGAADFTGPQDTTFGGFDDPAGWTYHKSFEPSQIAQKGASAYSALAGLPDPHSGATDYLNARRTPESVKAVAQNYDSLPMHDPNAVKHFDAMKNDVHAQHDFMTHRLGIQTQITDHDPYKDVHEMLHDVNNNKRLQVLGTHVTGGHPYMDDDTNDKFRAVHDFFGHAATGRSFDRHGEQAAYLAHAQMFSPAARPALATETSGQNSSLIYNGGFQPQKTAILHPSVMGLVHHGVVGSEPWRDHQDPSVNGSGNWLTSKWYIASTVTDTGTAESAEKESARPTQYVVANGDKQKRISSAPPGHFDDKWKSDTMDTINHPQTGGGFTMRDRPGDGPTSGTMVSLPRAEGHEESGLTRDQVNGDNQADYMDRKWDKIHEPNNYGGGWDEKGKWYNDVSKNFKDPWEAAGYAMKGDQAGVYDLDGYYDPQGKPTDVETPKFFHDQIAKGGARWLR